MSAWEWGSELVLVLVLGSELELEMELELELDLFNDWAIVLTNSFVPSIE